jgi:DNA-directed RNA polymerase subunit RPC12/RpoP
MNDGNVTRLDPFEGVVLPSKRWCTECGGETVIIKQVRKQFTAHCAECDHPIFVLKPRDRYYLVRELRARRHKPVQHWHGGGAAA